MLFFSLQTSEGRQRREGGSKPAGSQSKARLKSNADGGSKGDHVSSKSTANKGLGGNSRSQGEREKEKGGKEEQKSRKEVQKSRQKEQKSRKGSRSDTFSIGSYIESDRGESREREIRSQTRGSRSPSPGSEAGSSRSSRRNRRSRNEAVRMLATTTPYYTPRRGLETGGLQDNTQV